MEWLYKIAGFTTIFCVLILMLAWSLLRALRNPDGGRTFAGDESIGSLAGFGLFLIGFGIYLAYSKSKSTR